MRATDTGGDAMNEARNPGLERLLRPDEVAAILGVPLRTIYRWRSHHEGPRGYRVGRHVRYRVDDVEQWLDARRDDH